MHVPHFAEVDMSSTKAQFFDKGSHRATLLLPFVGRRGNRTLCVIGQNPSSANEQHADKTIRYLEEFIYRNYPEYSALLVLNLYSRVDTKKSATGNPLNTQCAQIFNELVSKHGEFLLVYGRLKNKGIYRFPQRAAEVEARLSSKAVYKLDVGTEFPPHPGNPAICYNNFDVRLARM